MSTSVRLMPMAWAEGIASRGIQTGLRALLVIVSAPSALFLAALAAVLLRPPDVSFYAIDRVALVLLLLGVAARAAVLRRRFLLWERASWPMVALSLLAVAGVIGQPFDTQPWSLLAAKFIVPFALFHIAAQVFTNERRLVHFETFVLLVLAYLSFTSIAFLVGANALIVPRFILDPSLGYHVDRARGPLLQAVANGVSLNLLGILALHSYLRGRIHGWKAAVLLACLPVAILATMTRAVWLSFAASLVFLLFRVKSRKLRWACAGAVVVTVAVLLAIFCLDNQRHTFSDRLQESGPVEFRRAVYSGGWQMFLEKPLTGWGANQMPAQLARHVSGYSKHELYPHNTYLELLVEHGVIGLALYVWLMWELLRLGRGRVAPQAGVFLDGSFYALWPILLAVYWINAALVVLNYQFVNGLIFTMAGILAGQRKREAGRFTSSQRC